MNKPIKILVTGAAGQIAYNLLFRIANGDMFGKQQKVILSLLEVPQAINSLKGVVMELEDCAFNLLEDIIISDNADVACKDVNWAILVGSFPRQKGMERKDLLEKNADIFSATGRALNNNASSDIKVLVVGNPCNTNCLISMYNAKDIPKDRFFAMTYLDQNRAVNQIAQKTNNNVNDISNMIIWGNHSATQVPDYLNTRVNNELLTDKIDLSYLQDKFISSIAQRGAEIINARGKSSAASASNAIVDNVRALTEDTKENNSFSCAVYSQGNPYGINPDLIFSFPCQTKNGKVSIVDGFEINDFLRTKLQETEQELLAEKKTIEHLLN